jgi:uncharacterized MAPEG superfamily protein
MTMELRLLAWALVLALVQIFLPSHFRNNETGQAYNAGPRDDPGPPIGQITGRLQRAQRNLYETLPLFGLAILAAHVAGRHGGLTLWGAWLYFVARVIYVPLYAYGIPYVRSAVWLVSFLGLLLVLLAVLWP